MSSWALPTQNHKHRGQIETLPKIKVNQTNKIKEDIDNHLNYQGYNTQTHNSNTKPYAERSNWQRVEQLNMAFKTSHNKDESLPQFMKSPQLIFSHKNR